jgi:hypothetical protein
LKTEGKEGRWKVEGRRLKQLQKRVNGERTRKPANGQTGQRENHDRHRVTAKKRSQGPGVRIALLLHISILGKLRVGIVTS